MFGPLNQLGKHLEAWGSQPLDLCGPVSFHQFFDVATARPKAHKPLAHIVPRWQY